MRMRNTSSRLARRTSTDAAPTPSPVIAAAMRSPSSVYTSRRSATGSTRAASSPHPGQRLVLVGRAREPELHHLAGGVRRDELARRALGHDAPAVHDHEPVAELLGLVHVVGREHERDAVLLQPVEPLPEHVARLRVEPGRRLVEQQHLGLVDERTRDREAALHAARERIDPRVAPVAQLHELEQLRGPPADLRARQVEVAAVDHEVVPHGELGVEVVLLRHDTEAAADPRTVVGGIETEHAATCPPEIGETQPIMRIVELLPAPFGPRKPNASPGAISKSMPSTATKSPKRFESARASMSGETTVGDASGSSLRQCLEFPQAIPRPNSAGDVPPGG